MISSFLSKLLTTRQASFTEKGIEIFELNFSMQPLIALVEFQKEVSPEKMEKLGYLMSDSIINHFKERFAIEEDKISNLWTGLFNVSGFGKLQVVSMSEKEATFELKDNNFAKLYQSKYGKQKEPVCHIICGILRNLFEKTTGKKAKCKETTCIAESKSTCSFEIKVT
jgi:predicted hydrocarbon binding protein